MVTHQVYACVPCRQSKRKCDKLLPKCSLCKRLCRECGYDQSSDPTASGYPIPLARSAELARFTKSGIDNKIVEQAIELLGGELGAKKCVSEYFCAIHSSFPILDPQSCLEDILGLWGEPQPHAEVALLSLCLLLLITEPSEDESFLALHKLIKATLSMLMSMQGGATMRTVVTILQCNLLVTLFELSQGMLLVAQISLSTATAIVDRIVDRQGGASGKFDLVCDAKLLSIRQGIMILKSFYCLCTDSLLAPSGIKYDDLSLLKTSQPRSEISEIRCIYEAAHLLGQAFRHIYTPTKMEEFNAVEAVFIMNTLVAYRTLLIEKEQDHGELMSSAKDLCNSAILSVLEYGISQKSFTNGCYSSYLPAFFQSFLAEMLLATEAPVTAPPFLLHSVFKAVILLRENPGLSINRGQRAASIETAIMTLDSASRRWRLASECLELFDCGVLASFLKITNARAVFEEIKVRLYGEGNIVGERPKVQ